MVGGVGRSTSLVAADGSKLVKVDLRDELVRSQNLARYEIVSRGERAKEVVVRDNPPTNGEIVIGEDTGSDKAQMLTSGGFLRHWKTQVRSSFSRSVRVTGAMVDGCYLMRIRERG